MNISIITTPLIDHINLPYPMYTFELDLVYLCSETNNDILLLMYQFLPLSTTNVCSCLCDLGKGCSFSFIDFGFCLQ